MSWIITGSFAQPDEPEALAYIAAVEAADGETLEDGVKFAYNSFIKGCKADGIWDAIKASCILAGARTLNGALVPLAGTAPTNYNFAAGDYNRKTGLKGNSSNKYLDSNYSASNLQAGSASQSVYYSIPHSGNFSCQLGARTLTPLIITSQVANTSVNNFVVQTQNNNPNIFYGNQGVATFVGGSRLGTTEEIRRMNGASYINSSAALTLPALDYFVFASNVDGVASSFTNAALAFYHIGESLDLALLDARVTTLMSDLAAAIP